MIIYYLRQKQKEKATFWKEINAKFKTFFKETNRIKNNTFSKHKIQIKR